LSERGSRPAAAGDAGDAAARYAPPDTRAAPEHDDMTVSQVKKDVLGGPGAGPQGGHGVEGRRPLPVHRESATSLPMIGLSVSLLLAGGLAFMMVLYPGYVSVFFILLVCTLVIGAACLAWYNLQINRRLMRPLNEIRDWAADMRAGNRSARLPVSEVAGLTDLASNINRLGDEIQAQPVNCEDISLQAEHLAQKTRMLEILYDVATSVSMARDLDELSDSILAMLSDLTGASAAMIRLVGDDGRLRLAASLGFDQGRFVAEQQMPVDSGLCADLAPYSPYLLSTGSDPLADIVGDKHMVVVPIQYRDEVLGVCNLIVTDFQYANREDVQLLLTSVGQHFGMAIEQARLDSDAKQVSIIRERTALAHELHDSLAQTLASLRFHVRVLDEVLQPTGEYAAIRGIEQIENSLDEAHTELRELIAHFRAPVEESGLVPAVGKLVKKFREETGIAVFLQDEWVHSQLPASLEIQVVRIVQEALANIRKHSKAHIVRVILRCNDSGNHRVLIEDDGIGIEQTRRRGKPGEHVGLSIMRERAQRLGGKIRIESDINEGTRVELVFRYPEEGAGVGTDMDQGGNDE